MSDSKPQFDSFQDAYCAAYRCKPEQYGWSSFRRCLHRHALLVAGPLRLWNPSFFQADFEVISAIGRATTQLELQVLIDEFENRRVVERDLLHATFRIRLSNYRLTETFMDLVPLLKPAPAVAVPENGAKVTRSPNREVSDSATLALRRLKRFHTAVVSGISPAEAAAEAGIALEEIGPLIERHQAGRPELAWLGEYLAQISKLTELREENERLMRLTADLTRKLIQPTANK